MYIPYSQASLRATAFARWSRAVFIKLFWLYSNKKCILLGDSIPVHTYQYKHFIPVVKETIITVTIGGAL